MTINLTVVFESKPEFVEKLKRLLQNLVELTRKESGCLQYDLHQSKDNTSVFVFHEVWESKAVFDLHNSQEYIKHFFEIAPSILLKDPEVIFTNKIA